MENPNNNPMVDILLRTFDPNTRSIKIRNDFTSDGKIVTTVIDEDYNGHVNQRVLA